MCFMGRADLSTILPTSEASSALLTSFAKSAISSALLIVLAISAASPITGITPITSSPADRKSPLNKSTGIEVYSYL